MSRRVLVVDDDESVRSFLRVILELEGFEVRTAADGAAALDQIAADVPDGIVLDAVMPGLGGRDVLRRVRADAAVAGLPVVLCTAYAEDLGDLPAAADDLVRKPFHPDELVRVLDRLLPRPRAA